MIDKELLEILACPETRQSLAEADEELLASVNERIAAGRCTNRGGKPVEAPLEEGALVREDKKLLYPIRDSIPVLLVDEGIELEG